MRPDARPDWMGSITDAPEAEHRWPVDPGTAVTVDPARPADPEPNPSPGPGPSAAGPSPKVRLRFAKRGDLRLVSHHDLMRCLERMARRAELPLAQSQGFNPRPKVSFTLALALGIEGHHEVVEMELLAPMEPAEVLRRLAAVSPPGLDWIDAEDPGPGRPAQAGAVRYALPVPADRLDQARASLASFLATETWPYTRHRPDRTVEIDLRPFLLEANLDLEGPGGTLRFRLKMDPGGSARPEELIEAFGLRDLLGKGAILARTEVELAP